MFLSVQIVLTADPIDWKKAAKVQTGVDLFCYEETKPRLMKIFVMRVDLKTPGLRFTALKRDKDWGKKMPDYPEGTIRTKRITVEEFLFNSRKPKTEGGEGRNMIVAVNAAPWTPWVSPYNHLYADPSGLNITDGIVITDHPLRAAFAIYEDGTPAILNALPESGKKGIRMAVSGFQVILKDGKELSNAGPNEPIHPRTAFGLSADKRYLYLVVVDGRRKDWSLGANMLDLCRIFRDAGASDAINMDGGGSTTMIFWDERSQKPVLVNKPSGKMRSVGSVMGIYLPPRTVSPKVKNVPLKRMKKR